MSKEILFKAKRIDNGEWVEGFYFCMVHDDGRHVHHFILPLGVDLSLGTPIEKIQVEVDPETVCQYTGLTDKNGNKIFEGDIVKIPDDEDEIYTIEWDNDTARFVILQRGSVMCDFDNYWGYEIKVIGNIFDNPELLDGSAE